MNCVAEWTSNVVGRRIPPDDVRFREGSHRGGILMHGGGDGVVFKVCLEVSRRETCVTDGSACLKRLKYWEEGVVGEI